MNMFKIDRVFSVVTMIVAMAAPALAAPDFIGGGGDDLWSNANNWSPVGVPTVPTDPLKITANARVQTAAVITSTLNVNNGVELIINADLKHPDTETNQDVTFQGTITQNAGDVYFSDDTRTSSGAIQNLNGGTFLNRDYYRMDGPSTINITGGSFTIGDYLGINGGSGTLKVVGDAATLISLGSLTGFGSGTLDIVLKDGGITTIDVTGTADLPGTLNVTAGLRRQIHEG